MRRFARHLCAGAAAAGVAAGLFAAAPLSARAASVPSVSPYSQVGVAGGLDTRAHYNFNPTGGSDGVGSGSTANLTSGRLVLPVGMAAVPDITAPGGTAVYVLDLVNPQAIDSGDLPSYSLTYRIQKLAIANGSEQVLATTGFTLSSDANNTGQFAASLAVDPSGTHVDVLVDDVPANPGVADDAYEVLEWPGTLTGTSKTVVLPKTLQKHNPNSSGSITGDVDGVSLAWVGNGAGAQLALGGNQYGADFAGGDTTDVHPAIEKLSSAGAIAGSWTNSSAAVNRTAQAFADAAGAAPASLLYGMSTNQDGSLNVSLGPEGFVGSAVYASPDLEPVMATVSADLASTKPILPDPNVGPAATANGGSPATNPELAATAAAPQDDPSLGFLGPPGGGTQAGGALAPSVIGLAGGAAFPSGLYAGLVYDGAMFDSSLDGSGSPLDAYPWPNEDLSGEPAMPARFGIRVFDAAGDSLSIIGNQTGDACALDGGSYSTVNSLNGVSMMALAAGPNGTIYALVQPDLDALSSSSLAPVDPGAPQVADGDRVIEFAPGAAGGTPCPSPQGSFGVTNTSVPGASEDTGNGPVSISAGSTLSFDAAAYDLQGDVPRSYGWDLDDGAADGQSKVGFTFNTASGGLWQRPTPTRTFRYTTPGTYTAKLTVVSDFGTQTLSRTINVTAPGKVSAAFSTPASLTATQPAHFDASASSGGGDQIVDYHWDFGDGNSDDRSGPAESWAYAAAGTYTVTLTVSNANGSTSTASHQVTVGPAPPPPVSSYPGSTQTTSTTSTTPTSSGQPKAHIDRRPTSVSPRAQSANLAKAVLVSLTCPKTKTACAGTVTLQTAKPVRVGRHGKPRTLTLGTGKFSLASGGKRFVEIALSKQGRALIKPGKSMTIDVIVAAHDAYGDPRTTTLKLTLHRPPKIKVFG